MIRPGQARPVDVGGYVAELVQYDQVGTADVPEHRLERVIAYLNTDGNSTVGDMMAAYLKQLVNDGVDGFRYDAAKHIELPGEYNNSSYWTKILANGSQYQYGEVLHDGISRDADYAKMFGNSAKGGGGITASAYGGTLRSALNSKNLNTGDLSSWDNYNVAASNLTS